MPRPFPEEFRRDVITVARKSDRSIASVAKDFGISARRRGRRLAACLAESSRHTLERHVPLGAAPALLRSPQQLEPLAQALSPTTRTDRHTTRPTRRTSRARPTPRAGHLVFFRPHGRILSGHHKLNA